MKNSKLATILDGDTREQPLSPQESIPESSDNSDDVQHVVQEIEDEIVEFDQNEILYNLVFRRRLSCVIHDIVLILRKVFDPELPKNNLIKFVDSS